MQKKHTKLNTFTAVSAPKICMYTVAGKAITSLLSSSRKYNKVEVKVNITCTTLRSFSYNYIKFVYGSVRLPLRDVNRLKAYPYTFYILVTRKIFVNG